MLRPAAQRLPALFPRRHRRGAAGGRGEARRRCPGLDFAGFRDGYFTAGDEPDIVAEIRDSGADCLFIGMPTPRKERFLAAHRDALNVPFIMGVGGGFDVLAGHVAARAGALQRTGLEWLFRIYQEPRRMWWRYAATNAAFAGVLAGNSSVARRSARRNRQVGAAGA